MRQGMSTSLSYHTLCGSTQGRQGRLYPRMNQTSKEMQLGSGGGGKLLEMRIVAGRWIVAVRAYCQL